MSTNQAKAYLLLIALRGINRIYQNGGKISNSETINNKINEYLIENDSVLYYLENYKDIDGNPFSNVYMQYTIECDDMGFKTLSKNKFGRRLRDMGYDVKQKKVDGMNKKIIVKR